MPTDSKVEKEFWAVGLPKDLQIPVGLRTHPLVDWDQNHADISGGIHTVLMFTENRKLDKFRQRQIKDRAKANNLRRIVVEEFKSTAAFLNRLQGLVDEREKEQGQRSVDPMLNPQASPVNGNGHSSEQPKGPFDSKTVPRHLSIPSKHSVLIVGADERRCFGTVKNNVALYTLCSCETVEMSPKTLDYIGAVILLKSVPPGLREWFRKEASERKVSLFEPEWHESEVNSWTNSNPIEICKEGILDCTGTSSGTVVESGIEDNCDLSGSQEGDLPKTGSEAVAESSAVPVAPSPCGETPSPGLLAELLRLLDRFAKLAPAALAEAASLEGQLEEEREKFHQFASEKAAMQSAIGSLEVRVAELDILLKEREVSIANLQTAKAMLDATLTQKQNCIQKLEEVVENLRKDLSVISQMAAKASNGK